MQETIKQLKSAIQQRKSTRSFENKNISKSDRQKLEEFIKNIPAILPFEYNANILLGPQDNKKTVFLINTTSAFAAVISNNSIIEHAMAGFAGELFVLYCQSIGISTCWIGAFKRNQAENIITGCCPGYNRTDQQMTGINNSANKILCLIALGYNSGYYIYNIAHSFLGDRVKIRDLRIEEGIIFIEMTVHAQDDPKGYPTLDITKVFQLDGYDLVEI